MPVDDRARLAWRCRRGTKELDLLLTRWLALQYEDASEGQRARFERLLALPDPQLASYLLAGELPGSAGSAEAAELAALIHSIRSGKRIMSSPEREP